MLARKRLNVIALSLLFLLMVRVMKRSLRESTPKSEEWLKRSHLERLEAVEKINRLSERSYVEQAFPRVHRVIRPTSS